MNDRFGTLRIVGICLHILALVVILANYQRIMLLFCLAAAALIAPASRAAVPGRPLTLYVAFGLLMGYVFWSGVSALNQQHWLFLILVLLIAAGSVWVLQYPDVPSLIFTEVAIVISLAIAIQFLREKPNFDDTVPDRVRQTGITMIIMLVIGLIYTALGVAEQLSEGDRPPRSKRPRARRERN